LLRLWVRIPLGAWMSVCCECCAFSGRDLCDELITHSVESYRVLCVMCVIQKPQEWGGHGPRWVATPQERKIQTNMPIVKNVHKTVSLLNNLSCFLT